MLWDAIASKKETLIHPNFDLLTKGCREVETHGGLLFVWRSAQRHIRPCFHNRHWKGWDFHGWIIPQTYIYIYLYSSLYDISDNLHNHGNPSINRDVEKSFEILNLHTQVSMAGVVQTNKTSGLGHQCFPLYRWGLICLANSTMRNPLFGVFLEIFSPQFVAGIGQPKG